MYSWENSTMTDQTKTTTMAFDLSKFTRDKYKVLMDKLIVLIGKEKPTTIAQVDAMFPKLGAEIDATEPGLKKLYDSFMRKVYKKGRIAADKSAQSILGQEVKLPFNQTHKRALIAVEKMAFLNIKNVNTEVKIDLRRGLYESIQNGEGVEGLTNRVEAALKKKPKKASKDVQADARDTPEFRAVLIARTELVNAYNQGNLQNLKQAGFEKKKWVTGKDERTCFICKPMDGQVRKIDELFVGKAPNGKILKTMAPTIHPNCRCSIIGVL